MSWRDPERTVRWLLGGMRTENAHQSAALSHIARTMEKKAYEQAKDEQEYYLLIRRMLDVSRKGGEERKKTGWTQQLSPILQWVKKEKGGTDRDGEKVVHDQLNDLESRLSNIREDPRDLAETLLNSIQEPGLKTEAEKRLNEALTAEGYCCCRKRRLLPSVPRCCDGCYEDIEPGDGHVLQTSSLILNAPGFLCGECWRAEAFKSYGEPGDLRSEDYLPMRQDAEEEERTFTCQCGVVSHIACCPNEVEPRATPLCRICRDLTGPDGVGSSFKSLAENELSRFLEGYLNDYLQRQEDEEDPHRLFVRVITSKDSRISLEKLNQALPSLPRSTTYRKIFLVMAQEVDNEMVPFLGIWWYVSTDQDHRGNQDTLYLSYLEGLPFAKTRQKASRSALTRKAIVAGMAAFASAGFRRCVFWAAAPSSTNIDYIFIGRATPQTFPPNLTQGQRRREAEVNRKQRQKKLENFYDTMLNEAARDGEIEGHDRLDMRPKNLERMEDVPLFDGDLLLSEIQDIVEEEGKTRRPLEGKALEDRTLSQLRKRLLPYYVIQLEAKKERTLDELVPTVDSEVAGTRLSLLSRMGNVGWSFSTERLAKFSLVELSVVVGKERQGAPSQGLLSALRHAVSCEDGERCRRSGCRAATALLSHFRRCRNRRLDDAPRADGAPRVRGCEKCLQYLSLAYFHQGQCDDDPCRVPFCLQISRFQRNHHRARRSL